MKAANTRFHDFGDAFFAIIADSLVDMTEDEDWRSRAFQHAMAIWIEPEVRRRQQLGKAPDPLIVSAAQVVLYPDGRQFVRLNEEVQGIATFDPQQPGLKVAEGTPIRVCDIKSVSNIQLVASDEANCGHFTVIRLMNGWCGSFDFRYNKAKSAELLCAAQEFLDTARDSISARRIRAAIDTLFSAAELAAKAFVITTPLNESELSSHGHIHSRFNMFSRHGNIDEHQRETFNALSAARTRCRYVQGTVKESIETISGWASHVSQLITDVEARIQSG